ARAWHRAGLEVLAHEISEQVLGDGGHFELSPMYHSLVQEDLLDLLNIARAYPGVVPEQVVASWIKVLERMRSWLSSMSHPDGEISFFNDAAQGIAASPAELEAYAERLGFNARRLPSDGITHLADSGYIRIQHGDLVALLDIGRIGPDYLPGHAHADTLSFEVSLCGQRMIVNPGPSLYEAGPERFFQRSTVAHNPVVVDGANSSEVWDSFRVARRAYPLDLSIEKNGDEICVNCAHDGYRRLPGGVTHYRTWHFGLDGFTIEDSLDGRFASAVGYLHLHPDSRLFTNDGTIECRGGRLLFYRVENGHADLTDYNYHPQFGLSLPAACLKVEMHSTRSAVGFSFA